MRRTTRKMRIRLDFVVEFDRDLETLPMGGGEDMAMLFDAMTKALRKRKLDGVTRIMPKGRAGFSLDYRKTKPGDAETER